MICNPKTSMKCYPYQRRKATTIQKKAQLIRVYAHTHTRRDASKGPLGDDAHTNHTNARSDFGRIKYLRAKCVTHTRERGWWMMLMTHRRMRVWGGSISHTNTPRVRCAEGVYAVSFTIQTGFQTHTHGISMTLAFEDSCVRIQPPVIRSLKLMEIAFTLQQRERCFLRGIAQLSITEHILISIN